jgi:hypothetical protein
LWCLLIDNNSLQHILEKEKAELGADKQAMVKSKDMSVIHNGFKVQ